MKRPTGKKIVIVSSEAVPYAKTGGLADVCGALPLYLAALGYQVKLFLPWYQNVEKNFGKKVKVGPREYYFSLEQGGVEVVFVKNDGYFWRDGLYSAYGQDYSDNLERFAFFCDRVLWLLEEMDFQPDIIHVHDWQTALVPILLKTAYCQESFFAKTRTILTIHNIGYQGRFGAGKFRVLEDRGVYRSHFNMHEGEFYGDLDLLKWGIICADWVTTVSPNYAQEVLTVDFGEKLQEVLKGKGGAFCGILNGIDRTIWDPLTDPNVRVKYDAGSFAKKKENKILLQRELGLNEDAEVMLLALVGRLTPQKGIDSVAEIVSSLPPNAQLAILGDGEEKYKIHLTELRNGKEDRFSLKIGHFEELARRYYAAADAFLIPSRFEPCGLTQMYSYRYGVLPIVFPVGGLVDTVQDFSQGGHGFVCNRANLNSQGLLEKIIQAHGIFFGSPGEWQKRAIKAMGLDFGWEKSIKRLAALYEYLVTGVFPSV